MYGNNRGDGRYNRENRYDYRYDRQINGERNFHQQNERRYQHNPYNYDRRNDQQWDNNRFARRNNNSRNFSGENSRFAFSTSGRSRDGGQGAFDSSEFSSGNSSNYFSSNNNRSEEYVGTSTQYYENRSGSTQYSTHVRDGINNVESSIVTNTPCAKSTSSIYSNYSLRQSNLFQFAPKEDTDLLKLTFLYAIARMIYENETNEDALVVVMAAEYASDFLHEDRLLYGRDADAYFVKVMENAVRDPHFIDKICISSTLLDTLAEYNLPRQYPTPSPVPLTGQQYMHILQILSSSLHPSYENCDLVALITAMIPCLQLDGVSNGYINRVVNVVERTLDLKIAVNIKSCQLFYSRFLRDLKDDEIENLFMKLRNALPQKEELRNILKKTPGGGLLPISLIGRALEECPDFPWFETQKLYEDDWHGVDLAIRAINRDRYYGYKANKSPHVDPQNYENLAWLAKTLCMVKLQDNFDGFDDWVSVPKKKNEAMKLIQNYINKEFDRVERAEKKEVS